MEKTYSIELCLSVGFGDIWFANLYSVTGDKKQKCVSNIKIPTCDFDELSWLKQYLEKRMDMLLLELKMKFHPSASNQRRLPAYPYLQTIKSNCLTCCMVYGLMFIKCVRKIRKQVSYHLKMK